MDKKKNIAVFHDEDIMTNVATCVLVEDYQSLACAIKNGDWDLVRCVADCLADTIDCCTTVADGLKIKPSGSSIVNMSYKNGILMQADGSDLLCRGGKPVSEAMSGGVCQCDDSCPYYKSGACSPEAAKLLLAGGFTYHGADSRQCDALTQFLEDLPYPAEDDTSSYVEYGGFVTLASGKEKLLFTTEISELLCWRRTQEKVEEEASRADGLRIMPDSIVVKKRKVTATKGAWSA